MEAIFYKKMIAFACLSVIAQVYAMQPVELSQAPQTSYQAGYSVLPPEIKRIIQKNVLDNLIVKDDLETTQENILNFSLINQSFRKFLNEPDNIIWLITAIKEKILSHYRDEVYIAQALKNLPGISNLKVQQWLEKLKIEISATNELFDTLSNDRFTMSDVEKVDELMKRGANANRKNKYGQIALVSAAQNIFLPREIFFPLLDATDINAKSEEDKKTILHVMAPKFSPDTVEQILKRNPDVNSQDNEGNTPLMAAIKQISDYALNIDWYTRVLETIEQLVKANSSASIKNYNGETALSIAQELKQKYPHRTSRIDGIINLLNKDLKYQKMEIQ